MDLFFLILLIVLMAAALGSGFPVAFALPGSAIITIFLAGVSGYLLPAAWMLISRMADQASG
ncbi:hypothetical protein V6L77_08630 [Pannonibacter sp. Pt2-lr]